MESLINEKLKLTHEPIGIRFTDEKPEEAFEFPSDKWVCVISMFNACYKGKVVAVSNETCTCVGGAVGLCFGDAFTDRKSHINELLSTGVKDDERKLSEFQRHGERFYASPELTQRWRDSVPYTQAPGKYRIFSPLSKWKEENLPDLVYLMVNPDQLSALVIMSGFLRGSNDNVISPYVSACQAVLMAYQEIGKEYPKAVMGGFDISQRNRMPKEFLTLTMPFSLFEEIEEGINEGCLTTESWKNIANRYT